MWDKVYHTYECGGIGINAGGGGYNFLNYEDAMEKALKCIEENKDDIYAQVYVWVNNRPDYCGNIPPHDEDTTILLSWKNRELRSLQINEEYYKNYKAHNIKF